MSDPSDSYRSDYCSCWQCAPRPWHRGAWEAAESFRAAQLRAQLASAYLSQAQRELNTATREHAEAQRAVETAKAALLDEVMR